MKKECRPSRKKRKAKAKRRLRDIFLFFLEGSKAQRIILSPTRIEWYPLIETRYVVVESAPRCQRRVWPIRDAGWPGRSRNADGALPLFCGGEGLAVPEVCAGIKPLR